VFKQILDIWSQRDLSLIGKIAILKSLAFSLITYQCCSLEIPDNFIDLINDIAFKFLWSNKPEKVKRKTIIADYCDGGLKMLDIFSFTKAQKAMWVKRLHKGGMASWKAYPYWILNKFIGPQSTKCNLDTKKNTRNIPSFYWTVIKNWVDLNDIEKEDLTALKIRKQCIWLNKNIKVGKQEINWQPWIDHKIILIHNIVNQQGIFLSKAELDTKYNFNCNVLEYNSIKMAIPAEWRRIVKSTIIEEDKISAEDAPTMNFGNIVKQAKNISNKMIYQSLIKAKQLPPITKEKWNTMFELDNECWTRLYYNNSLIRDTKIRTFQYKIIMNLIPCNLYLYKIGQSNSFLCDTCNATDNITHYFYDCNPVLAFWSSFQSWWNNMTGDNINISRDVALMGTIKDNENHENLNACLMLARWHIYTEHLNKQQPCMYKLLCKLKYKIKVEKQIHLRNNKITLFNTMWREIEEYID
jgi:hypothetical protein